MNGHAWKAVWAVICIGAITALWTGNARLASLETGLKNLGGQVDFYTKSFDARILYLERQRWPTVSRDER